MKVIKLNLKLQLQGHIYAIIVMHTYMLMKRGAASNNRNKGVTVKDCAQFINGIIRINNAQVDDAHDIHAVMSMYNLLEFSNIYSKTSEILWQ